ncbi:MAG: aldo/keto reductase [Phycisphaerales bacterium]|nr:aldo/keto reductase [Phycisphaerales bacterium]
MTTLLTDHRPFGNTGLEVSPLGFGGAPIGVLETGETTVATLLNTLLDRGVNLFDTATMYRGSQDMIGTAIGHRRDEYVIVTKCGLASEGNNPGRWTRAKITHDIDQALTQLRTRHIDVMLLHSCSRAVLDQGDALDAIIRARDAGKVRFAGYSGDNETAAHAATLPDIRVIQASVNICDQANIDTVLPVTSREGVGVMAKRPIANAAWKPTEQQYEGYRTYYAPYRERFETMGLGLEEFASTGETTWAGLALRFTLSQPGVSTAIIGSTNPKHIDANVEAAARGPLDEESINLIRGAFTQARAGRDWPGLT